MQRKASCTHVYNSPSKQLFVVSALVALDDAPDGMETELNRLAAMFFNERTSAKALAVRTFKIFDRNRAIARFTDAFNQIERLFRRPS